MYSFYYRVFLASPEIFCPRWVPHLPPPSLGSGFLVLYFHYLSLSSVGRFHIPGLHTLLDHEGPCDWQSGTFTNKTRCLSPVFPSLLLFLSPGLALRSSGEWCWPGYGRPLAWAGRLCSLRLKSSLCPHCPGHFRCGLVPPLDNKAHDEQRPSIPHTCPRTWTHNRISINICPTQPPHTLFHLKPWPLTAPVVVMMMITAEW